MRTILFILVFFICATGLGQTETKKLTISHLTKDFYVYTTFGDPGDGSLFPAKCNHVHFNTFSQTILYYSRTPGLDKQNRRNTYVESFKRVQ